MLANGVVLEGLRSFMCDSACLIAPEIHLSNPESAVLGRSTYFHSKIEPSLNQPEIGGKHSKYSLCCFVTAESCFAVAVSGARLTNCYWTNQHRSCSIPDGRGIAAQGKCASFPPLFHSSFKKMANKHWTCFSHAAFPSWKEWLQTSADTPFCSFLGGIILAFLL